MATTARGQAPSKFMYFISNPKVRNQKKQSFLTRRLEISRNIFIKRLKNNEELLIFFPRRVTDVDGGGWLGGLVGVA